MNCKESIELISARIDGMLDEREARLLQAHLESCANCRDELEALEKTVSLVKGLEEAGLPPRFLEGVRARLKRPAARGPVLWRIFAMPQAQAALAACVLVALCFFAFHDHGSSRQENVSMPVAASELKKTHAEMSDEVSVAVEEEGIAVRKAVGRTVAVPEEKAAEALPRDLAVAAAPLPAAPVVKEEMDAVAGEKAGGFAGVAPAAEQRVVQAEPLALKARSSAVPAEEKEAVAFEMSAEPARATFMAADAAVADKADAHAPASAPGADAVADVEMARESVAEGMPVLVSVTVESDDKVGVGKLVEAFVPVRKDRMTTGRARMPETAAAKVALSDSFTLNVSQDDYQKLLEKLRGLGEVSVEGVEPAGTGTVTVRITVVPTSKQEAP